MADDDGSGREEGLGTDVLVKVGYCQMKVCEDGTVYRQTHGEWRQVKSGLLYSQAVRKAGNLHALRAGAAAREAGDIR